MSISFKYMIDRTQMFHLYLILHLFIGATLSGIGIVAVLLSGVAGTGALLAAIGLGFAVAFPVARVVARNLTGK
ncbi:CTP synthetase [Jhaorihella thermophila]|nr:CTP synthetase [Jhaorihella thermophila]